MHDHEVDVITTCKSCLHDELMNSDFYMVHIRESYFSEEDLAKPG